MYPLTVQAVRTVRQPAVRPSGGIALGPRDRRAYAVNLLLDRPILEYIDPVSAPAGATVSLQGSHFPLNTPVSVLFDCHGTVQTAMSLPTNWPRMAGVKVPSGLTPGYVNRHPAAWHAEPDQPGFRVRRPMRSCFDLRFLPEITPRE